ncbi:hypothetical protein BDN70DRAFT_435517 [Pholiota conissans]|uniref:Uncharacterized protein n=1 Tax=Pholiota conissans TaxID=109636 RepID=A0A9P5YQC2_9AGAR|nr:hypothetical protein BDN70DRAFT_435517 [Pholiota conissans]
MSLSRSPILHPLFFAEAEPPATRPSQPSLGIVKAFIDLLVVLPCTMLLPPIPNAASPLSPVAIFIPVPVHLYCALYSTGCTIPIP